jgi:hypothetical protein
MGDLPPDAERLHAILRWLEKQTADNDIVGVYLRVQRDAVLRALADVEDGERRLPVVGSSQPPARRSTPAVPVPASDPRRPGKPFKLERMRTPNGPVPTAVHTADCHMAGDLAHAVNATEARLALTESGLPACQYCRPDLELGLDTG